MPSATSTHRNKRPYQPSITSFFSPVDADTFRSQAAPPPSAPVLPDAVQASLLTVGMRIRKAVPEGYKTHKTTAAKSLDSTSERDIGMLRAPPQRPRELVPYCGLLKVGGMEQSVDGFGEEWMGSQESNVSVQEEDAVKGARKRCADDEDEDEDGDKDEEIVDPVEGRVYAQMRRRVQRPAATEDFEEAEFLMDEGEVGV
ncbi:hypothetical protein EJ06DRAFT_551674 [Trichodelitschia bisporula]|uniref:Uncharacterized protein n=1 Tax=Trichodelitschia bisporula TaxID=703511 RepID=A0A6G1HJW7_9PEZI|nr:hypothetical protein EJ06DRAFT_551674 [Trichodelitschia bisporula]